MEIIKSIENNILNIIVKGRLDTTTSPQLEAELKNVIDNAEKLVFDFSELEYISSAGLRVLLTAKKAMNNRGEMVVKNINETIREIFEITGFSDVLTIE